MPNWCYNTITIEGDAGTLSNMDFIMRSDGYEQQDDMDKTQGQPMRLVPMPKVLTGTVSPHRSGEFDHDGTLMGYVNDPENSYWTPEVYAERKAEHYALVEQAKQAEAETGHPDWYGWALEHWDTKWAMQVRSYDFSPEEGYITISGDTAWAPPIALLKNISLRFPVTISISFVEEGMDFIGAAVIRDGERWVSDGSFSDHLPDDFDWDNDDAYDVQQEVRDRLFAEHESAAAASALQSTQFMNG